MIKKFSFLGIWKSTWKVYCECLYREWHCFLLSICYSTQVPRSVFPTLEAASYFFRVLQWVPQMQTSTTELGLFLTLAPSFAWVPKISFFQPFSHFTPYLQVTTEVKSSAFPDLAFVFPDLSIGCWALSCYLDLDFSSVQFPVLSPSSFLLISWLPLHQKKGMEVFFVC